MAKKRLVFVVDDKRDSDILSWWVHQENKSAAIRALIRRQIKQDGVTLYDIYQAVIELDRKLASEALVATAGNVSDVDCDEPPDVVAALDNLGL
jgi:hypothetical protein